MIRKDREINEMADIMDVLKKCDTLSIAMQGDDGYPYVVPVSFGVAENDDKVTVYFHGAKHGMKTDLLEKNPRVCIEGHVFHKVEPTKYGITTRYESIIAFGTAIKAGGEESITGLKSITAHYGYPGYPIDRCKGLSMAAVYKIEIESITAKRNTDG